MRSKPSTKAITGVVHEISVQGAAALSGGLARRPALYFPGDERHSHPSPQELRHPRGRAPRRAPQPRGRRGRPRTLAAGRGSPASGPARRPAASSRRSSGPAPSSTKPSTGSSRTPTATRSIEQAILPLTNADVEIVQAEEGKPLIFKATVQVRPEVELGDYKNFNFRPEIETIDDAKVDRGHRGAARPERDPGAGRGPRRPEGRLRGDQVRGQPATASRSKAARRSGCR